MASKSLLNVQNMFTRYLFHVERVHGPFLKRNIHIPFESSNCNKKRGFSKTFKIILGTTACISLWGLFIMDSEDEYDKKARLLKAGNLRKSCNFIADVVELAADAVVHITVEDKALFIPSVRGGSGFIIKSDGLIVTNAHVVGNENRKNVLITLRNGTNFVGVVKDVDEVIDLALIHINTKNLPVLKLGSGRDLRPGEWVAAIGSPFFLSNSVTAGVVSSVHRKAAEIGFPDRNISYIQTDTAVLSGNSGGPLVNLDGEVVGVNTMTLKPGISFAIPSEYVEAFLQRYKNVSERGKKRFYIGMSFLPLTPNIFNQLQSLGIHLPENLKHGIYVWKIEPNSPAYRCGLQSGDVIFEVEGRGLYDIKCLYDNLEKNETVNIKFYRKGLYYKTVLTAKKLF